MVFIGVLLQQLVAESCHGDEHPALKSFTEALQRLPSVRCHVVREEMTMQGVVRAFGLLLTLAAGSALGLLFILRFAGARAEWRNVFRQTCAPSSAPTGAGGFG
jgi:hypothetical protein